MATHCEDSRRSMRSCCQGGKDSTFEHMAECDGSEYNMPADSLTNAAAQENNYQ
jgi:hypothetical protein